MKVLYIGPYKMGSGYAHAAIDYILALDNVGINVIPRSIYTENVKPPERILELEKQDAKHCEYVIQHGLPNIFEYHGNFKKCIGMYCSETNSIAYTDWVEHLNLMDEVWAMNKHQSIAASNSAVTSPVKIIHCPTDTNKFEKGYKVNPIVQQKKDGQFLFYTIAEISERKNIVDLLIAFHTEFAPEEPANIVLKIYKSGASSDLTQNYMLSLINKLKEDMHIYNNLDSYKQEIIISQYLSDEEIYGLHNSCDCYITTSHGEAWGLDTFNAMGFGKTPIAPNYGGIIEFLNNDAGWLIDGMEVPVIGNNQIQGLYTPESYWFKCNIKQLRKAMREAYSNQTLRESKSVSGIEKVYDFTYTKIGEQMKGALLDAT